MEEKFREAKYILVVGIGGSDLASKAVWNAVTLHKPEINKEGNKEKKVLFLESPDTREYEELESLIKNMESAEEFVFIGISKSGETEETLGAFQKTYDLLEAKFVGSAGERTIIISKKESSLWKIGEGIKAELKEWEGDVGGRWSAFTVAHQTVLKIAGLNVPEFLKGKEDFENSADIKKEAAGLAKNIFESYKNKNTDILDLFLFNDELEDLGKWCRQLVAESLGKTNSKGEKVGLTPAVSIGPTDLHSMLQLDLGGPANKFTLFIASLKEIKGLNEAAYENTMKAYGNAGLPFSKYEMQEITEREIGKFMEFMMEVVLKLAEFLEVNPLDQPDVENYKKSLHNE